MTGIKINDLQLGMELDEPVRNLQGKVLFDAGSAITEKHVKALKAWGVTEVQIVDFSARDTALPGDVKDEEETEAKQGSMIEARVQDLFKMTDCEDPVIQELYRLALARAGAE